jgi:RNA polymerase-binding protein DksA
VVADAGTAKPPAPAATGSPTKQPAVKANGASGSISVPQGSEWTRAELAAIRKELVDGLEEMREAYERSLRDLNDLQQAGTDGAGDDQADAGSKTFEREQEQSIAANRLDLLTQMQRAVERIDAGTYGFCESCGKPIPKARLKAFPSATLDVACKQREERR